MRIGLMLMAGMAAPALAAPATRDLCPSLAGLDTGACTLDAGHVQVESDPIDLTHDRMADRTEDRLLIGHMLLRYGLGDTTEVQAEWAGVGRVRDRDRTTRRTSHRHRAGDATLAVRQNLRHPDGSGFAIAVQPSVTLPVGRQPVGAGDWGAALIVPIQFALTEAVSLTLDPEVDAAVDEDGDGRHLAYGGVFSLGVEFSDRWQGQLDYAAFRDRDPAGHATAHRAAATVQFQPGEGFAVHATAVAGLDRDAPDAQLFVGLARRF